MAGENLGYRVTSAQVTGDLSSSTAVIAAVAGHTLSLKRLIFSASSTAAQTVIVEDAGTGTDRLGPLQCAINGGVALEFSPGRVACAAGTGMNVIVSTSAVSTAYIEAWVLPSTG